MKRLGLSILFGVLFLSGLNGACESTPQRDALKLGISTTKDVIQAENVKFTGIEGNTHELLDYKGKVIVLNLWATWCPSCRLEMPSMEQLYQQVDPAFIDVLAISVEQELYRGNSAEVIQKVESIVQNQGYTFSIGLDRFGEVGKTYQAKTIPVTYIIDPQFNLEGRLLGAADWSSSAMKRYLQNLSKAP
jgi:thiol-disulfide isomerase/thioredoxin